MIPGDGLYKCSLSPINIFTGVNMQLNDKKVHRTGGTVTSEGFIPHLPYKDYMLLVKLDIPRRLLVSEIKRPQPPLRYKGYLVFALPGGGEYVSHLK